MEKSRFRIVAAILVVVVIVVLAVILSMQQRNAPIPRLILQIGGAVEGDTDDYGRTPASGDRFLEIAANVTSHLSTSVVLDNTSVTVWANGTYHSGTVAPPGRVTLAPDQTAPISISFELPFSSLTEHVRITAGGATVDTAFSHRMSSGGPPRTIGVARMDTASDWVLEVVSVPTPHTLTTTTFVMRWPSNLSIAIPPGQATLESLKTPSGGVQYLPVTGAGQTNLLVGDAITISKFSYVTGMLVSIADGVGVLWSGTL